MIKKVVATANHNRKIIEIESHGQKTYKILQSKQYVGKTSNGGYRNMKSAIKAANQ